MTTYPIYVAGEFIKSNTTLKVHNPFDQSIVAETYTGTEQDLDKAILGALKIERHLAQIPSYEKSAILNSIADAIENDKDDFALLLCRESAKPLKYSLGEIERAIQTFRVAAEECKRLPAEYLSLDWTPAGRSKQGIVRYFPIGLVAAISPFNFPLNLAVHKIAPAIAAGCPVILKPSSSTPLSTLRLAQIIDKTTLPKGAVSIIPFNRQTGNKLVTDDRFKLLTFTGSPAVGWKMKQEAGKKKVVLELGGNAGVIVAKSADIDDAVVKCISGGFSYSGQVCIHTQRIFIAREIFDEFTSKFIQGVRGLVQGDPVDLNTDISVMIDTENAQRVEEWVREAVEDGAQLLTGGKRNGSFFEPTLITGTNQDMKVCALEVFGPVVTIDPYNSFEEAIELINNTKYGLQAGVFTGSIKEMDMAHNLLEVGGVIINDIPTFRVDHMPYGGVKESGLGREGVRYAMKDMMEPKILVKDGL